MRRCCAMFVFPCVRVSVDEALAAEVAHRMVVPKRVPARQPLMFTLPIGVSSLTASLKKQFTQSLEPIVEVLAVAASAFIPLASRLFVDVRAVNDNEFSVKASGLSAVIEVMAPACSLRCNDLRTHSLVCIARVFSSLAFGLHLRGSAGGTASPSARGARECHLRRMRLRLRSL